MLKRVFKLFQIARKFSTSGAVATINEIHQLPSTINLFFNFISIGASSNLMIIKNLLVRNFVLLFREWGRLL